MTQINVHTPQRAQRNLRTRTDCRLCGSRDLILVLSLGETPLANEFVETSEVGKPQDRFPLNVHLCRSCGHAQLLDVVDPARLFRDYVYVSGTSPVFVEHFRRYAEDVLHLTALPRGSRVLEIGSNDGTLLQFFKDAGMRVLGVDPAHAIAAQATQRGIETLPEFFDLALARRLRQDGWEAALIAANNVFAHADDLHGILEGVTHLLHRDGLFVFEVSYLVDVVEKGLFDTIYHEHLSYHAVKPLAALCERHDMELIDAIRVDSHGGSLRGIAKRRGGKWPRKPRVDQLIRLETSMGLFEPAAYHDFLTRIAQRKEDVMTLLRRLKQDGKRLAGFGAPAKATTLMFHFGIGPDVIEYLIDDSPWKQGLYSPGHHLPVVASTALYEVARRPDDVVILAWNFAESILAKHRAYTERGGHFIVPLPRLEVH
ncbi:MAG: methyltransferase domain-containing protein [Candidatus Omnitrophica bacterium]|nr:methyltransferase domain-containing protein [Candidatus Omnitrophota bacterium]